MSEKQLQATKFIRKNDVDPVIIYSRKNNDDIEGESCDKATKFHYNLHKSLQKEHEILLSVKPLSVRLRQEEPKEGIGKFQKTRKDLIRLNVIHILETPSHRSQIERAQWLVSLISPVVIKFWLF